MKRVGGRVTWLLEFDRRFEASVRDGLKRQTVRRCRIVEPGDMLRLASADTGRVFGEAEVTRVVPIRIEAETGRLGIVEGYAVSVSGNRLTYGEADTLAGFDGFGSIEEMCGWLAARGKLLHGIFEGQIIEW